MFDIIGFRYVSAELHKISYFILLATYFESFKGDLRNDGGWAVRTIKTFEKLPIEWEGMPEFSDFKKNVKYYPYPIYLSVTLHGKLNGDDISIKMDREAGYSGGFRIHVTYRGKKYPVLTNLNKMVSLIDNFAKGEQPKEEYLHNILRDYLKGARGKKLEWQKNIEKNFLMPITDRRVVFETKWYKGYIRIRVIINDPEGEDKEEITHKLKEHSSFIPSSIVNYLQTYLKSNGVDISKLEFNYTVKQLSYNTYKGMGIEITIK